MGQDQSRINQQHELYRSQLNEMRKQEALNEEQRRRQADELCAQTIAAQKRAAHKEKELQESIRRIEEEQLKRAQENSVNSFHNEVMKEYDEKIKEKNAELDSIRLNTMKEMEDLRKAQEDKNRGHLEDLSKIHEKIVMLDENHTQTVKKLLEEGNVEGKEMQNKIIEANRQFHEATFRMVQSRTETTAITMAILNNVVAKGALEKDANNLITKVDAMRQSISRMEDHRRKIVDWLVETDLKKHKKGFNALLSRAAVDKGEDAQAHLKSISKEGSILETLLKEVIPLLSNAAFDRDLIDKAKGALNFGVGKISDLHDEIASLRVALAKSPRSVNLDGVKACIKDLDLAINSVPSMVSQTTTEYIHEEMKKLEIKDQEFMNNAIAFNPVSTQAIEAP